MPTSAWPEHVLQTASAGGQDNGVGFTVVNFNTSACTLRCVASLASATPPPQWVMVLDNGSGSEDFEVLLAGLDHPWACEVRLFRSVHNLGFAAGSNFLVDRLLALPMVRHIGLLNNDAVAKPCLVAALLEALDANPARHGLAGGRMHKLANEAEPDTLGIALYASLMPADRHSTEDTYLGPTGGCCLLTVACARDLIATMGYFFDPHYFCYCEDTDLVLRANLLGYEPAYTDTLVALHQGQASSGGAARDDFIAYHGVRNVIWMHVKLMPTALLWRHSGWLLLAHTLWAGRKALAGNIALPYRVYRDALRRVPELWAERRRLGPVWRVPAQQIAGRMHRRFYRKGYVWGVLRQLWTPGT